MFPLSKRFAARSWKLFTTLSPARKGIMTGRVCRNRWVRKFLNRKDPIMTKINRRDYLIKMGVGAGAIIGAANLDVFSQRRTRTARTGPRRSARTGAAAASSLLRWPITYDPPSRNAFVTAIFGGLMGFAYNTKHYKWPVCEIAFQPGNGHHVRNFKIFTLTYGQCRARLTLHRYQP